MNKIDLVQKHWNTERAKDVAGVLAFYHSDGQLAINGEVYAGHERLRQFYTGIVDGFRDVEVIIKRWTEQGNFIAVEYDCRLTYPDGTVKTAPGCNVFEIVGDRFQSVSSYIAIP